jgi:hypothetical protein
VRIRNLIPLISVLALASCGGQTAETPLSDPGRAIVPRGTDSIRLAAENREAVQTDENNINDQLRVRLSPEYIASQVVDANLDLDETEEQIIVFKRRDDESDRIRLLVVTFDTVRNAWIRAWEGVTAATSVRSFSVYPDDLTGDLEREIVAIGINENGEQTLDVFRRTSDLLGLGLSYVPILSVSADVTIEIEEIQRSEAYAAMETLSAPSYPIHVERRNPESENVFDTIRTTYFWDSARRAYVPGREEEISGETIADSRLRDLYAGTEEDFEAFLSGPWYRSSDAGDIRLAFFGIRDRSIVFHSGYLQQAFDWLESTKTVYGRGITLFVQNESIRSVKNYMSISVEDLNRITVGLQGVNRWEGTYERLGGSLQADLLADVEGFRLSAIAPSGLYRGDGDRELVFSPPEFTYRVGDSVSHGGYAIFEAGGDTVLTLKSVDNNRLPAGVETFRLAYEESSTEDRIVRRIELEPGAIGIAGFYSLEEDPIVLEQIQVTESEQDTAQ